MNITERSSKDDIIDASVEVIDSQAATIETLQSQMFVLFWALGLSLAWQILF
jgi:hypothetical protein